jgi:hypothetical protein
MQTMTLMPLAVAAPAARRAPMSIARLPRISGMPSVAYAGNDCTWSSTSTAAHVSRTATAAFQANHKALKAFGSRRLGETST